MFNPRVSPLDTDERGQDMFAMITVAEDVDREMHVVPPAVASLHDRSLSQIEI